MSRSPSERSTERPARSTGATPVVKTEGAPKPDRGGVPGVVVSVDTGGTFTDLVLRERDGSVRTLKVPSTPDDPGRAILEGLAELLPEGGRFDLLHGSTVATNALLERTGGRVVLVTNAGFEDVLEIGRQNRPQLYALTGHRPPPLVPAQDRLGIPGRLDADGSEFEPLEPASLRHALESELDRLREADAIAVCLLHAYADPTHERRVAELLRELLAETDGGGDEVETISLSSEVLPEFREYERSSTTVVNAYVAPVMRRYLGELERALSEGPRVAARLAVMGSAGGLLPVGRAVREPVHTILSGPAGGVVGARAWAERTGRRAVVSFDMGGTSTDVALCPEEPLHTREFEIGGQPVAVPVLDIHTVGAGGGSIARVDPGGALRVGPESAGARPGPICYGRGGTEVTVTDAHVWLGRLPVAAFLGGTSSLARDEVEGPLHALAEEIGCSPEEAAAGVLEVADTTMERALRVTSVERGWDPAELALVAFGGAGALHAAELAGRLGCAEALIPPSPGLLSAFGILVAPPRHEVSRTLLRTITNDDPELVAVRDELAEAARGGLVEDGVSPDEVRVACRLDARYRGQSFELAVEASGPPTAWLDRFHLEHRRRYGYAREEREVECVTLRAVAAAPAPPLPSRIHSPDPSGGTDGTGEAALSRSVRVWMEGEWAEVPMVRRSGLEPGTRLRGPAVVSDYSSTTWVPPEWRVEVHPSGVLRLRREGEDAIL